MFYQEKKNTTIQILEFVKVLDCYPNVSIAYRILLTIPVIVVCVKRSSSKLKMLKFYLHFTMSQEMLNELTILCIEKEMLKNTNFKNIINKFTFKMLEENISNDVLILFAVLLFFLVGLRDDLNIVEELLLRHFGILQMLMSSVSFVIYFANAYE